MRVALKTPLTDDVQFLLTTSGGDMLFLFNDEILEIAFPEARLTSAWRTLGCGDPGQMRAVDAVDFVQRVLDSIHDEGLALDERLKVDLACLLVAKTGANAALFVRGEGGRVQPRLTLFPETALRALRERVADGRVEVEQVWSSAA